jgi:Bacterial Ig domain/Peptidase M10 serralysin C terminal/RTX calcium-binding nonapeptide repeat (4 copies)
MADINLSTGDDSYTQPASDKDLWNNIHGGAGNDTIRIYQGIANGQAGNDRFEKIVDPANLSREVQLAFWNAGNDLLVNLAEGWANDGQGGRDTFSSVDFNKVHGSGAQNARVIGNANDNYYWPNWGTDTFEGGAGTDGVSMNSGHIEFAPGQFRNLVLDEINIVVSADGRRATFTPKVGPSWSTTTLDVEYFDVWPSTTTNRDLSWTQLFIADFITQQTMAQETVAAGGSLRWNAASSLGAAATLTYSFVTTAPTTGPGATGFRTFTSAERQLVRDILAKTAALTNISFTEVTESGSTVGQMRLGVSQQSTSKGIAFLPNAAGAGDQAGDVWMDVESMLGIAVGSEGYQALLHEIGHALGLRHPRNSDPGDNWSMQLLAQHDKQTMTVMSGTAAADGLFRSDWGPLDVLALRYLYGTRSTNTGDNTYALAATAGDIEQSITDDGGSDTIDASALATGVQITLVPGGLSNVGFSRAGVVGVDNLAITVGSLIENAIGTAADDELIGNDADNRLTGGLGNDWLDGGKGNDTAVYAGPRSGYEVDHAFGVTYVKARDGVSGYDTLLSVERLQFADATITLAASPLAEDVKLTVDEDTPLNGSLPTPSDLTSRAGVTWTLLGAASRGTATVAANGNFSYTPSANFWGGDSFGYRVSSGSGSNEYRVYVDVKPVNDGAPQGTGQTLMVRANQASTGRVPLASDADGDALTYSVSTEPEHGALLFSDDGRYTYTPNAGFIGDDAFGFTVSDGLGGSNAYTMTLRVGLLTREDTTLETPLPDPVGAARSAATYSLAAGATLGQVTISAQGALRFVPTPNANGSDQFTYEVAVGATRTRIIVDLSVTSVDDGPPVAAAASYALAEDGKLDVALPRAVDPDGDVPIYSLVTLPLLGTATVSAGGQLVYTPRPNEFGSDSITYRVADSGGAASTYTVPLTVNPMNDVPLAASFQLTLVAGRGTMGLLPTGLDVDGDGLLYALDSAVAPTQGSVVVSAIGRYSYTPRSDASGSDRFGYLVSDGEGGISRYVVAVTIQPAAAAVSAPPAALLIEAGSAPPIEAMGVATPDFNAMALGSAWA